MKTKKQSQLTADYANLPDLIIKGLKEIIGPSRKGQLDYQTILGISQTAKNFILEICIVDYPGY